MLGFKKVFSLATGLLFGLLTINSHALPTLQFGLEGAQGVEVNGSLYDVSFMDGSCEELFGGCDEQSDFIFATAYEAQAASQALLDQVFTGVFDMEPELTQGCSSSIVCYVNTPYSLNHRGGVEVSTAANASIGKWTEFYHFGVSSQLAFLRQETWAVWTRSVESVASVPEPASAALLLAGIAGLVLSRRHAKR